MFNDLNIKHTYKYPEDNIVDDFYNKILSNAKTYDRVSGYFTSQSLLQYAVGIEKLINNNGKMRFIISRQVPENDFDAIINGYELRKEYLKSFKNEISPLNNLEDYSSFSLLSYLISKGKLDIKVGFCSTGIFHSKFGIMRDEDKNKVMFMGSHNETGAGIKGNYEMFNVTASWLSSKFDQQKIIDAEKEFEKLWNNSHEGVVIVKEFSETIKNQLELYNPSSFSTKKGVELTIDNAILLIRNNDEIKLQEINLDQSVDTEAFEFIFNLNIFFENEQYPRFRKGLSHIDINDFIDEFSSYCNNKNINFIVDSSVYKWIEENNFLIEERMMYGNMIKNKEPEILNKFNVFSNKVSDELERILRLQQMWAAFYMTEMKKGANFSVPGSGKTSMIYGAFGYLNSDEINKVNRIIMIGPKNSFDTWKEEFELNYGKNKQLSVLDIHDENKNIEMELIHNFNKYNLILVNYESLPKYEYKLLNIIDERTMLVFDEVHRIKAVEGKRAKSALKISLKSNYKYVLTGTPIPNGYQDIYNFLNILFDYDYGDFFEWNPKDLKDLSYSEVDKVNKKLAPFYWRTNKKELNVPPANPDHIIEVDASKNEQDIINMLYKKYYRNPLLLYIRLMQVSSNPALLLNSNVQENIFNLDLFEGFQVDLLEEIIDNNSFTSEEISLIKKVDKTQKYQKCIDKIKEIISKNEKVVVWCVFVDTIKSVANDLESLGIEAVSVYGDVSMNDRLKNMESFKNGSAKVLVTNPHTLGEAVSLHKACHNAIYMEYTFNLTHMLQSRDRIHRLGLEEDEETNYYYMMLRGKKLDTIDFKMYLRLKEKEKIMLKAIENDYLEPMPSETKEDILELFS